MYENVNHYGKLTRSLEPKHAWLKPIINYLLNNCSNFIHIYYITIEQTLNVQCIEFD